MTARAAYFSPHEAEVLVKAYQEVREEIKKKGNTATAIKQREQAWQRIADRLNASNRTGPKRTWQQVKIKYKNILQNAVKKSGGPSAKAELTLAEDIALALKRGGPVWDGTPEGSDSPDAVSFIQACGGTVALLEPQAPASPTSTDGGPDEGTSAAEAFDVDDDENVSLGSRRKEGPDGVYGEGHPGHLNSQVIRQLHVQHLRRQIQLTDLDIEYRKRKLEDLLLESEIKRKSIRKLDLELKKLHLELHAHDSSLK